MLSPFTPVHVYPCIELGSFYLYSTFTFNKLENSKMGDLHKKSVKELQAFLKKRNVAIAKQPKAKLVELCAAAIELANSLYPQGNTNIYSC